MNPFRISNFTTKELYRRLDLYLKSSNPADEYIIEMISRELDRREVFDVVR